MDRLHACGSQSRTGGRRTVGADGFGENAPVVGIGANPGGPRGAALRHIADNREIQADIRATTLLDQLAVMVRSMTAMVMNRASILVRMGGMANRRFGHTEVGGGDIAMHRKTRRRQRITRQRGDEHQPEAERQPVNGDHDHTLGFPECPHSQRFAGRRQAKPGQDDACGIPQGGFLSFTLQHESR